MRVYALKRRAGHQTFYHTSHDSLVQVFITGDDVIPSNSFKNELWDKGYALHHLTVEYTDTLKELEDQVRDEVKFEEGV